MGAIEMGNKCADAVTTRPLLAAKHWDAERWG